MVPRHFPDIHISEQVDFNDRDEEAVRYNEIYTPSVPLDLAQFGDFGCRFRYNKFDRQDYWWTGSKLLNNISIIKKLLIFIYPKFLCPYLIMVIKKKFG